MQLIYLSPLPWNSFSQRPHKFVDWFHTRTKGRVFWVDPYPTRFPVFSDLLRIGKSESEILNSKPDWLNIFRPVSLPIEPLPFSGNINALMWRTIIAELLSFSKSEETLLVCGKPSAFASLLVGKLTHCRSVYDGMDDFPAFYSGMSSFSMHYRELNLVRNVTDILVSSSHLLHKFSNYRDDIRLVYNALDIDALPDIKQLRRNNSNYVFGYIGTIGNWFDWKWVIELAKVRQDDTIRLIGPRYVRVPEALPDNIEIFPQCSHEKAVLAMQDFDVGLIPFLKNTLTDSVDPIKYYEYRSLGLPVVSTRFGEMHFHSSNTGVYISDDLLDISQVVNQALSNKNSANDVLSFRLSNSWYSRFDAACII